MSRSDTHSMLARLSERDVAILQSLREHRLLSTNQLRRLHFASGHTTAAAATRSTIRVLSRLESQRLVSRLTRRIGGVRRGSSGLVWQVGPTGERLLRALSGDEQRRRYVEGSGAFTAHTIATAELALQLTESVRNGTIELVSLETEPTCWRSFVGSHGGMEYLKPDLFAVTAAADFEDHWFIEADLGTEHPPVVVRKAQVYQRYATYGAHQARHGLFPAVLWVVPSEARRAALSAALAADKTLQAGLFKVTTTEDFLRCIHRGSAPGASP
jgi:Replication-relaxation